MNTESAPINSGHTTKSAYGERRGSVGRSVVVGVGLLAISGGLLHQSLNFEEPAVASMEGNLVTAGVDDKKQRLAAFWEQTASPMLQETKQRDELALANAHTSLTELFKKYDLGVPKFADSITGWGIRFKILYRTSVESLEGKAEKTWTQQLVQEKFAQTIVSQPQLEKDLLAIGSQFAYELEANRNVLLSGLETELTAADLSAELSLGTTPFREQFTLKLNNLLASMPGRTVKIGAGSLAAGIAAEEAVRQIIRVVVAQLATRLAATAVAAGGTAGAAAVTGAGGGTAVAPGVGTAVGLVGGFIVGAFVDWKMTDEFETKVEAQVREFLKQMQTHLESAPDGLLPTLRNQAEQSESLYDHTLKETFVLP